MRAKAKSSSTPYPIWVEGEYITEPPIRPSDGAIRPAGHYIDKGGYPGANVYEVDINTMCRQTDAADRFGKPIYEQDILLYETAEEIGYFIADKRKRLLSGCKKGTWKISTGNRAFPVFGRNLED